MIDGTRECLIGFIFLSLYLICIPKYAYSQESVLPSVVLDDVERYRLSDVENARIYSERIRANYLTTATRSDAPVAIVIVGQPGAGKSSMMLDAAKNVSSGVAFLDEDDLREFHPSINEITAAESYAAAHYVWIDAKQWAEKLMDELIQARANLLVQRGSVTCERDASRLKMLRDAGYRIHIKAIAVAFDVSEQGALERYEQMKRDAQNPRMISREQHARSYRTIPAGLDWFERESLVDSIEVVNRDGAILYENVFREGGWLRPIGAGAALERERLRPKNPREAALECDRLRRVASLMTENGSAMQDPMRFSRVDALRLTRCETASNAALQRSPFGAAF